MAWAAWAVQPVGLALSSASLACLAGATDGRRTARPCLPLKQALAAALRPPARRLPPLLPEQKGQLIKDPRSEAHKWRELLAPLVGELSLEADASHVAEVKRGRRSLRRCCLPCCLPAPPGVPLNAASCTSLLASPLPPPAPSLQLMNVAFARHEIVGETTNVTLAWLEAGGRKSVKAVEEELQRQAGPPQEGL